MPHALSYVGVGPGWDHVNLRPVLRTPYSESACSPEDKLSERVVEGAKLSLRKPPSRLSRCPLDSCSLPLTACVKQAKTQETFLHKPKPCAVAVSAK